MSVKAAEFGVVAEARRAAESQMKFFNTMMAAKSASTAAKKPQATEASKKPSTAKNK